MIFILFKNNGNHPIKLKFFNFLIITIFFSLINIIDVLGNKSFEPKYKIIKSYEDLHSKSFVNNFFTNQISDMKKFREINVNNILSDKTYIKKNEYPDISVIITVYNQANCFYSALRSVQNQSLKNLEIIIVDDCSLDNSTEIIEKYMKEDNRIIFLKHESNDGKIKSRSDAVRIAKGKYITIIDGDDSLSNENILFNCYNIANLADLDVVEFNYAFYKRKKFRGLNANYKNIKGLYHRVIYQPELSFKFIDLEEKDSVAGFANRNIVAKLIKNKIFKDILKYIGTKYLEDYLLEYEDTIMSVSLFRIANSYYYRQECGYYVAKEECENQFPLFKFKKCRPKKFRINNELDPIKYLNFLLETSSGKLIENYLIYKELISIDYYKKLDKLINSDFSYVYIILDKINSSNYYYKHRQNKISIIKEKLLKKENIIKLKIS